jgi:hypothetical protein
MMLEADKGKLQTVYEEKLKKYGELKIMENKTSIQKNINGHALRFIFFPFVLFSFGSSFAQNLSLTCEGKETMTTSFSQNQSNDSRSYQFKNGKLFGYIDAVWSADSINVILPRFADENMERLKGHIAIDRLSGTVFEQVEAISKRYSTEAKKVILIISFQGKCEIAKAKF